MIARDLVALLVALLAVVLPGTALLLALGVRRPAWLVGLSPAASVGVATLTAVVCAVPGVRYGPLPLGVVTAVLLAVGVARLTGWRRRLPTRGRGLRPPVPLSQEGPTEPSDDVSVSREASAVSSETSAVSHGASAERRVERDPGHAARHTAPGAADRRVRVPWRGGRSPAPWRAGRVLGLLLVLGAVVVSGWTWWAGLGTLATVGQEHDMITHHLVTAYIQRTGHGAPWQLMPTDVLTDSGVAFYPAGLHLLMAPVATLVGDTVVGMNAVTVVLLGFGWATSVAVLTHVAARRARLAPSAAALAAGIAAVVAVGLYRPVFSLLHEGGILPNATTLVLTPGVLAALLTLRRGWAPAVGAGIGAVGALAVHPSALASVGVSLLGWWVGDALTRGGPRRIAAALPRLALVGAVALVAGAPVLAQVFGVAGGASSAGADVGPAPFGPALGNAVALAYSGYVKDYEGQAQVWAAALALLGVVAVLVTRRALGTLTAWAGWLLVEVAFLSSPARGADALVTGFFYHAHLRVWSHLSLFAPVLAGLGVVLAASGVALWSARLARAVRPGVRWAAVALAAAAGVAYLVWPASGYARVESRYLATRYATPDFVRVDGDDEKAIDWLADRVRPGERVLNSANDGSTFLYVRAGLPIVNTSSLGNAKSPHTYRLLKSFNRFPSDAGVRAALRDLNVRWVYVDTRAPTIGAGSSPEDWVGGFLFSTAAGLRDLDGLPGLELAFRSGTVSVYGLDLGAAESP
ncbi:DUF6541 family protein [Saccharothrix australiensis]|uniref:4-amino-4-deoxy-L-arabinose transferase-like glycosyltransferase n=1 Tax=Saccharothrix australiensis TaxID=2072 RepID=A0A495VWE8_9PSEU|nr:DUF6541 family protein [Saccharothrix australiensis]RKT51998.1 hypothetical protein C8E97_0489 [Saccharothrix australiensis]